MSDEDSKILQELQQRERDAYLAQIGELSLRTDEDNSTINIDKLDSSKSFLSSFSSPTADRSMASMYNYITTNFGHPLHSYGFLQSHAKTVRDYYKNSTDTLQIPLVPTTNSKIFDVKDLYVPIILKRKKITPDLDKPRKISPQEVFTNGDEGKQKKFLIGPSGIGKTTEIKMWLYEWCSEGEPSVNPLGKFSIVFYVDCAKLSPSSSLGEAVAKQCFPNHAGVTPADVEKVCRDCPNDILVILDNFGQGECWNGLDKDKTLYQLIHGECFQGLHLLVVTTPSAIIDCEDVYGSYDNIQATDGISEESVQCYIKKVFQQRPDFGEKVLIFLKTRQLVPEIASSPVLLSGVCQIMKWVTDLDDFGTVHRVTDLVGKFIEVYMKHNAFPQPEGLKILRRNVSDPATSGSQATESIGGATSLISTQLPGENTSLVRPLALESRAEKRNPEISDEKVVKRLAMVAFGCFDKCHSRCRLSEADFNVCHNMKNFIISRGCQLGLLKYEGEDEIYPTSPAATEGKVIQFKNAHIQDYLAAVHLKRLVQGTDEEQTTFTTSLRKIQSANDCLTKRDVLKYACGLSLDAGRAIIEHVIDVKESESRISASDRRRIDTTEQAERLSGLEELLLQLNYEANAGETFNSSLVPALCDVRLVSPTELTKRHLQYFRGTLPNPSSFPFTILDCQPEDKGMNLHDFGPNVFVSCRDSSAVQEGLASSSLQDPPPSQFQMREKAMTKKMESKVSRIQATKVSAGSGAEVPSDNGATASSDHGATLVQTSDTLASAVNEKLVLGTETPICNAGNTSTALQDTTPNASEILRIDRRDIKFSEDTPFAEGRFGQMFEATWQGKTVAVKRIRNVNGDRLENLIKEVKINRRLNHKNIVPVYAYTEYRLRRGNQYRVELVMPLIEGCSLDDAIFAEKIPFLETDEGKLTVAMKICDAIAHIHAKGFTHSDIKPSNVLIRKTDNELFVCDLGLGHAYMASGLSMVSSGIRTGVQRWTCPEAVKDQRATVKADIWSLSSVLLELFTGMEMWKGIDTDFKLMNRLLEDDVTPPILQYVQDESLRHLFQRCFSKDPGKRPSAQELGEHFRTALAELRKCGSGITHKA